MKWQDRLAHFTIDMQNIDDQHLEQTDLDYKIRKPTAQPQLDDAYDADHVNKTIRSQQCFNSNHDCFSIYCGTRKKVIEKRLQQIIRDRGQANYLNK